MRPEDRSDADVLDVYARQAQRGDRQAFRQLVLAVHDDLRAWIGWRVASVEMVDDVLQETLVAAWKSLGEYHPGGSFRAWIRGIARHRCLMALRERRRQLQHRPVPIEGALVDEALRLAETPAEDPDWRLVALRHCLEELPEHAHHLIAARYWRGEALVELIDRLGKPKGTVAAMLHRIRRRLRSCIQAQEPAA